MTNKMQLCGTIYCPLIALYVSSDIIAHHQELLNCIFTASCVVGESELILSSVSPTTLAGSDVRIYHQKL